MSDIDVIGLYQGITRRALRLETRQRYAVPWEEEDLAAWHRGEPEPPTPQRDRTMETLRLVTASGRRIGRVRFVELPLTEYSRHEFEVAYPHGRPPRPPCALVADRLLSHPVRRMPSGFRPIRRGGPIGQSVSHAGLRVRSRPLNQVLVTQRGLGHTVSLAGVRWVVACGG
jgi:hypothetical protein